MFNPAFILVGAYGRRYTTAAAVLADWEAGKDFQIASGPAYVGSYTSIRDVDNMRGEHDTKIRLCYTPEGTCGFRSMVDPIAKPARRVIRKSATFGK